MPSRLLTWGDINVIIFFDKLDINWRKMRTKFRFQEQLEIYISKNYIAKELGSIAPCAMVASQPLNAVVEERGKTSKKRG